MKETVVVKVGGHLLYEMVQGKLRTMRIREYAEVFRQAAGQELRLIIVVGGGAPARIYIDAARGLGASEALCDQIGILITRLNAWLMLVALGEKAYPHIPASLQELLDAVSTDRLVVMGGLQPGQSTDAVAAIAAELSGARLMVKATDVDGIYTADPKTHPEAEKIEEASYEEILEVLWRGRIEAGRYALLDPVALRILERSRIPLRVIDGTNPQNLAKALAGQPIGTLVRPNQEA